MARRYGKAQWSVLVAASIAASATAIIIGCGGGGGGSGSVPPPPPISKTIGSSGGTIANGLLSAVFPSGALASSTTVTISFATGTPGVPCSCTEPAGGAYDLTAGVTSFNDPVALNISYPTSVSDTAQLKIAQVVNGDWKMLATTVDTTTDVATADCTGPGTFVLMLIPTDDNATVILPPCGTTSSTTGTTGTTGSSTDGSTSPPPPPSTTSGT